METRIAVLIAAAFGLSACNAGAPQPVADASSAPASTTGEVSGIRDGRTTLAVGQTLRISLPSNATTGYSWKLAETYADLVTSGSPFGTEIVDPHPSGMVGVGGNTVWTFHAVRSGTTTLTFTYARQWERDTPPAETATYRITVR